MPSKEFTRVHLRAAGMCASVFAFVAAGVMGHLSDWDFNYRGEHGQRLVGDLVVASLGGMFLGSFVFYMANRKMISEMFGSK